MPLSSEAFSQPTELSLQPTVYVLIIELLLQMAQLVLVFDLSWVEAESLEKCYHQDIV